MQPRRRNQGGPTHPEASGSRSLWGEADAPFQLFVESVKEYAIFMLDRTGHIVSWNAGAERIKGYSREEILGSHFSRFYPAADVAARKPDAELEIATAEGRFEEEGWRVRKDGSLFWASVVITAVRDRAGELIGFGKVTRDMTSVRRHLEELEHEVLRRTEQLRTANEELTRSNTALHTFTHSVAHDLRGPLRTIQGFAEILAVDQAHRLDDQGRDYLQRMAAAAKRLADLVQNLLTFARLSRTGSAPAHEPVSLDRVVGEIIKDVRADIERAGAEVAVRGPLGYVEGHRETVSVAIRNLFTNAIKFVSDGQRPRVDVSTARAGGRLRLSIRDNGIGVPASEQTRIFTPFERLHANAVYPGTGLGLAIVAAAIRSLGGEVGVESDGRTGSCFWIELPESAHGEDARGDANTAR